VETDPQESAATPSPTDAPLDLSEEVDRLAKLPSSANELDELLAETPEELKRILKEEFRAEFLGPVVVDPSQLD